MLSVTREASYEHVTKIDLCSYSWRWAHSSQSWCTLAGEQHVGNLLYAACLLWLQINGLVSSLVSLTSRKRYVLRPERWGGSQKVWVGMCHFWIATETVILMFVSDELKPHNWKVANRNLCCIIKFITTSDSKNQDLSGELQCRLPLWG